MPKCYMVRAMWSSESDFKVFLDNDVVATGWSRVDFSKFVGNVQDLRKAVYKEYYEGCNRAAQVVGKKLNEVARFMGIKKGDYVIVPYWSEILLAEVTGEFKYDSTAKEQDLANQLTVKYRRELDKLKKIPRCLLSEGLQRRLRVRGNSVASLHDFSEEIIKLFENEETYIDSVYQAIQEDYDKFKKELEEVLTSGENALKTGGEGLERLVAELMQCEGYDAKVLSKQKFEGAADADVEALKEDRFGSVKIFIQVKHHHGFSGSWGIEQLEKIKAMEEYNDYEFAFVTSAKMSEDNIKRATDDGFTVIDGAALAEWILDNYNKLSNETLLSLRISKVPHIVKLK